MSDGGSVSSWVCCRQSLVQLAAALLGDLKQITWPLSAPSAPCLLPVWQGFLEGILMGQLTEAQILQHLAFSHASHARGWQGHEGTLPSETL